MSNVRLAITGVTGILLAAAAAAPVYIEAEGWVLSGYRDPIGVVTACAGDTRNVVFGRTYTYEECVARTVRVLVDHGNDIAPCIKVPVPTLSHGAFISFASNMGAGAFCGSTMNRLLNAGDLAGACRELTHSATGKPQWIYVKTGRVDPKTGKPIYKSLPGLVKRRALERAMCERGLAAQ